MGKRFAQIFIGLIQAACLRLFLPMLSALVLLAACGGSVSFGVPHIPTPLIRTATATVNGKSETILTSGYSGFTLYYRTSDKPPTAICSGECAKTWPPLDAPVANGTPVTTPISATPPLPGNVSAQLDANGEQLEYNGHPLYTYSGDTAPGQTTGEGIGGVWHVATPSLA